MIGIRDCEEVICWEVKDKCHGEKTQKIFNRSDRSAFRWPYYAHTLNDDEIVINYFSRKIGIRLVMPFQNEENYIHKICFSNSCDLYVLAHETGKKIVIYRICAGKDSSIEMVSQARSRFTE